MGWLMLVALLMGITVVLKKHQPLFHSHHMIGRAKVFHRIERSKDHILRWRFPEMGIPRPAPSLVYHGKSIYPLVMTNISP